MIHLLETIASFKFKLIRGTVIIVLLMGGVSIGSYFLLVSFNVQSREVLEVIKIATEVDKISGVIPHTLEEYLLYEKEDDKQSITDALNTIQKNIDLLHKHVRNTRGAVSASSLQRLNKMYSKQINDAIGDLQKRKKGETTEENDYITEIKRVDGFIKSQVEKLIDFELTHYHNLKTELKHKINPAWLVILLTMAVVGILSITGSVLFANQVTEKIIKLARTVAESRATAPVDQEAVSQKGKTGAGALETGRVTGKQTDPKEIRNAAVRLSQIAEELQNLAQRFKL